MGHTSFEAAMLDSQSNKQVGVVNNRKTGNKYKIDKSMFNGAKLKKLLRCGGRFVKLTKLLENIYRSFLHAFEHVGRP